MPEETAASSTAEDTQITFNVKSSSDSKWVFTLPANTTVLDLKNKLATPEYADLPVERQRLIYSGRVLKDPDTLASFKIKDGHTIHLVKGAASNARQNPASQSSNAASTGASAPAPAPAVPTMATGTANDPLAALTGARYAGFHNLPGADMFGADGGMGAQPDASELLRMMENPMFLSQMNEAMNNPAVINMMRNSPMVRNNPMARQMLENPELRRTMFSPEMIRMQLQLQRQMGNLGGGSAFPAPGATDTTPQDAAATPGQGTNTTENTQQQPPTNPFALFGNTGAGSQNPFAALFGAPPAAGVTPATSPPPPVSAGQGAPATATPAAAEAQNAANPFANLFGTGMGTGMPGQAALQGGAQQPNPFSQMAQQLMQNPEAMRSMMQMMGGMGGAGGDGGGAYPMGGLFNPYAGQPAAPPDNRPPEERYAEQLRQLNDMGFYEFERNVQALRRSGGSVQGAVEYLLNG